MARRSRNAPQSRPALSALELEVMDTVWSLGDCTSAQVTVEFQKKRPLAPTTIRTVLSSLRDKRYIEPIPTIGRGFMWHPVVPRESVARRSLRELLATLFQGSPRQAIACMLDDSDMTDADLEEIRKLIETRRDRGTKVS
ncbi:MAG TPA: BlaI/MecI/CopY family transcriptional regulator [Phycisphaerae bacterium]|jgi:BlaI family penicillinase repressor|nr:BlaI/MecI/CopY family transcriptional regulator [Phycisphaerae bacterium]HOJ55990.1 BlaI/MecI/CopY family transcriptional regulator [Phycisphaerae bacterium]HOL25636.1 BlaI/MecI/CopY family transcriptional regulator [Phycisphaerae bacterium]HPP22098.1 BlaI/MecI/CopY family transcriptional regulator [Phycisphaerae bacterium]HPU31830.1 BlaI/MecI/CopY family transcriptional regulator [Phycisphaerae bacterium]